MKKKIIYSSALAALLSASSVALAGGPEILPVEPDYFSGFYVGGTGSLHHTTLNGSNSIDFLGFNIPETIIGPIVIPAQTIPEQTLVVNDADGEAFDAYGGVQAGFGKVFNHQWYLGIQVFGEWGNQEDTSTNTSVRQTFFPGLLIDVTNTATLTSTTQVEIDDDYGVAAKIGYVIAPRTMVYGKIGASWADIDVTNTAVINNNTSLTAIGTGLELISANTSLFASSHDSDTSVGLLLGIGFEQFVYQDLVSLNVEYDYVNYGTTDTGPVPFTAQTAVTNNLAGTTLVSNPVQLNNLTTQANGSATVSSVLAGINFYFGRDWI